MPAKILTFPGMIVCGLIACQKPGPAPILPKEPAAAQKEERVNRKITKSDEEWKKILTPEQYYILRQKGTERAFTGQYHDSKKKGTYLCAACGTPLFRSMEKFDSGTGWPSFWAPISPKAVDREVDRSLFRERTEVLCNVCGGHLGHVFDDGPPPTGKRYCINSAALKFSDTPHIPPGR